MPIEIILVIMLLLMVLGIVLAISYQNDYIMGFCTTISIIGVLTCFGIGLYDRSIKPQVQTYKVVVIDNIPYVKEEGVLIKINPDRNVKDGDEVRRDYKPGRYYCGIYLPEEKGDFR